MDQYIIGQEEAKKIVSVAVYNHYKRINHSSTIDDEDVIIEKSNILLLGPTGTGKTLIAKTLSSFLNVPFAIADATVLTEAGYVGEDVENILVRLYQNANYDEKRTEIGIIYIDEIDKIAKKSGNPSITRDVSGEGVQQSLLKILEGTQAKIPPKGGRKHPEQSLVSIDTSNILFICGGAFQGLDKIIKKRKNLNQIGFSKGEKYSKISELSLEDIHPEDLIHFGFIPELIGRLPIHGSLHSLSKDSLLSILVDPKNSLIKQYEKLFEIEGVKLNFTPDALVEVVGKAIKRKTGARALRSILEQSMLDVMYELPSLKGINSCTITKETIQKHTKPIYKKLKKIA